MIGVPWDAGKNEEKLAVNRAPIIRDGVPCQRSRLGVLDALVGVDYDCRLDRDHLTGVDLGLQPAFLLGL